MDSEWGRSVPSYPGKEAKCFMCHYQRGEVLGKYCLKFGKTRLCFTPQCLDGIERRR